MHQVDPLTAYLNQPQHIHTASTIQTSIPNQTNTIYNTVTITPDESQREEAPMLTTLIPAVKTTPISMHSMGTLQSRMIALNQEHYQAASAMTSHAMTHGATIDNPNHCDYCKLFFPSTVELAKHRKR